ncbi:hypothetical protein PMF13cell1_04007 [Blautia producta]|uniref:Peptidase S8/S53 domain-containing protein n=2 Tax=Blautia producta TaxID=33035 RepID=A0A4P6M079_9FIRM|nr:hypothetical protein PMF13cell1_04007 [Blautia producta]
MECNQNVASEDFADFIISNSNYSLDDTLQYNPSACGDYVDSQFSILYIPMQEAAPITTEKYEYYSIPNLYTTLDTSSLEASHILDTLEQPLLNLRGQGTIIGFIDTGIDYQNPLFRLKDGRSRILGIWDQTLPADITQKLPPGMPQVTVNDTIIYGTKFTNSEINKALENENPLTLIPSIDATGHGTILAEIAAGSQSPNAEFIGAAPECNIAVVKLKPAKQYLRDFYLVPDSAEAYQENDIMMGIKYLTLISAQYRMPLVICLGLGTNTGSHEGTSPLGLLLRKLNLTTGFASVVAAGNEVGMAHHYLGSIQSNMDYEDVEITVAENEKGFTAELWASTPELYTVGFVSPTGQIIQRIPLNNERDTYVTFTLENTHITVHYVITEQGSGSQFITMRFQSPTPGIWRIRVYNYLFITGSYHIWLPITGFISSGTVFLNPNPYTTITEPANAYSCITIGAYNHWDGSLYIHSSYGNNRLQFEKPNIVAPGVNVYSPSMNGLSVVYETGTSVAAAHVAGAVAILMTWGIVHGHNLSMNANSIRTLLIRGADRNPVHIYPSREWGMGRLNLYQTILRLRE